MSEPPKSAHHAHSGVACTAKPARYYTKNKPLLVDKLKTLIEDTPDNLNVICDFDETLSHPSGYTSWCAIERSPLTSDVYRTRCHALYAKYQPISIDLSLTHEEKVPHMEAWWSQANEALRNERFSSDTYAEILKVANSNVILRSGCAEMVEQCSRAGVPFVIFSAGIADIIDSVARTHLPPSSTLHIAGNRLSFSASGQVLGFAHAPVHVFNKNEETLRDENGVLCSGKYCDFPENGVEIPGCDGNSNVIPRDTNTDTNNTNTNTTTNSSANSNTPRTHASVAAAMHGRRNAIVMGDSVGDADICRDVEGRVVLRVGFLHVKAKKPVEGARVGEEAGAVEEGKEVSPASTASTSTSTSTSAIASVDDAAVFYDAREREHIRKYCDRFDIVMVGEDAMGVGGAVVEAVLGLRVSTFAQYTVEDYEGVCTETKASGETEAGAASRVLAGDECVCAGDVDAFVRAVVRSVREWRE